MNERPSCRCPLCHVEETLRAELRDPGNSETQQIVPRSASYFGKALQKRVKIALGTDACGFDWKKFNQAKEFEYYVRNGMTPMQAIRAGTSVAAVLLGWSETAGTVEAGKWAETSWPLAGTRSETLLNCRK
jgi:imidazolonepropionase-like amidohydrolase